MNARHLLLPLAFATLAARGAGSDPAEAALARWVDRPEPYVRTEGKTVHPVALGVFGGAQTGAPEDDVAGLRLGLATEHHNVGVFDLNLLYGYSGGFQRGFQLGSVNVVEGPLSGMQLGILVSVCGVLENSPSTGAQASLLVNYADGLDGVQLGLAFNRNGVGSDDIRGAQLGLINAGAKEFRGLQLGAVNGCAGEQHGLQIGLLNTAGAMNGVQFGLVNMATTSRGWQIGLYNDVQHAAGVQIGLANWATDADLPLLPFFRASF